MQININESYIFANNSILVPFVNLRTSVLVVFTYGGPLLVQNLGQSPAIMATTMATSMRQHLVGRKDCMKLQYNGDMQDGFSSLD